LSFAGLFQRAAKALPLNTDTFIQSSIFTPRDQACGAWVQVDMYTIRKQAEAEQLVEQHAGLVHRIAYHLKARLPATVLVDDLIQVGMLGLLDAWHHYDPSQGASFETYATIRIRGSMLDELRRNDWAPKSVHRKARELLQAAQKIEARTGREARAAEIAALLGLSLTEYHQLLQAANACRIIHYADLGGGEDDITADRGSLPAGPLEGLQRKEFRQHLVAAINALPEREKLVVGLYYDEEFNLREIGEILGVTESRISQLLSQAHTRLRTVLHENTEP